MTTEPSNNNVAIVALFAFNVVYPIAGIVLSVTGIVPPEGLVQVDESIRGILPLALLFGGLVLGAMSLVLPRMLVQAEPFQRRIIGMAVSDCAGTLGLVLLLLLGDLLIPFVLWAIALATGVQHLRRSETPR